MGKGLTILEDRRRYHERGTLCQRLRRPFIDLLLQVQLLRQVARVFVPRQVSELFFKTS